VKVKGEGGKEQKGRDGGERGHCNSLDEFPPQKSVKSRARIPPFL